MSFFRSCFRPCLGGSDSARRQTHGPPADVAKRTQVDGGRVGVGTDASTMAQQLGASTHGSVNQRPAGQATNSRWTDFLNRYRNDPNMSATRPADMPSDELFLRAPVGEDEKERQLAVFKYGMLEEQNHHEGIPEDGTDPSPQNTSLFRICNLARTQFKVNVALISLLDDECQYFKSESGMEAHGLKDLTQIPRDISFCGHTILNKAPTIILDTTRDWRMANNPLVANPPHVRFYAGVPIVAPEGYALGTLCIIGLEPKENFDGGAKLQELAALAMNEIRSLYERNMAEKQARMTDVINSFPTPQQAHADAIAAHVSSALDLEEARLRMQQGFTPEQQAAVLKAGKNQGLKVVAKTGNLQDSAPATAPAVAPPIDGRPSTESAGQRSATNTLVNSNGSPTVHDELELAKQKAAASNNPYDLSVLLIAQTLNLDLVYLLALDDDRAGGITTRVVSAHGLATDSVFDAGLHFRALRSKSGLLYVHPDPDSAYARELGTYISGMLVPVLQLAPPAQGGYVLAAFTRKKSQIFVAEDLKFLRDFGISLMKWLLQADARALEEGVAAAHNANNTNNASTTASP